MTPKMYTIQQLRIKVMDCVENYITSKELGDYCYEAWFYHCEGEGKDSKTDKRYLNFLLEISSEWGAICSLDIDELEMDFPKEFLKHMLLEIESYMNLDDNSRYQQEDSFV